MGNENCVSYNNKLKSMNVEKYFIYWDKYMRIKFNYLKT